LPTHNENNDFDTENPALQEYIGKRVSQDLEKCNLKNKSDFSDLLHQAKKLQDTKHSVSENFTEDLLDKLKEAGTYKNSIYHAIDQMSESQNNYHCIKQNEVASSRLEKYTW